MTETPELSRRVLTEHIARSDASITVEATLEERAAVAERLMLPAIASLRCVWTLRPRQSGMIEGHGTLQAKVTQACVVSLDPFDVTIAEQFQVHFILEGRESDDDDPDAPDELVYDGVAVDLGEATVEQLALTLDPYPRKPGAAFDSPDETGAGGVFAALAKLRDLD
jgi:hypothetical protein